MFQFGSLYLTRELIWSDLVKVCAACKLVYSTIDDVSIMNSEWTFQTSSEYSKGHFTTGPTQIAIKLSKSEQQQGITRIFRGSPLNLATWQKQHKNHPSPFSGGVFLAMEQRSDWLTRVLYTGAVLGGATFAAIAARFVLTQPFWGGGRGTVNIGSRVKIPTLKQTSKEAEFSFFLLGYPNNTS